MSQFEFLRSVPIGQYLPVDSVLHRLDPRARILAYVLLVLSITFSRQIGGLVVAVALVLVLLQIGRIPLRYALKGLVPPLPFLLFLALLQVFFNNAPPTPPVLLSFWIVEITISDVLAGVMLLVRFTALILALGLTTYTLSTSEMTQGLNVLLRPLGSLGIPAQDLVMMVQVTLRFLPMLAQGAERIAKAQASRGADWDSGGGNILARIRQVTPVIIPLFISSLNRAENMALAMDARAYGSVPERTSLVEMHFIWRDTLFVLGMILVGAIILVV
ncbi:MAG: energy-coupling factor transporter transmembrane protein EcfT [Anaerolineae bacterium]|nr:energy-coupling factor transporter transmembrane protein EcfT [Anaerolineae bacterium]